MMNILEEIVRHKAAEVKALKKQQPLEMLRERKYFSRKCLSMKKALTHPESSGIIAEFKRKSPSKGLIRKNGDVAEIIRGYASAGAAACSVLTDHQFFGGSLDDLTEARRVVDLPLLRKDFIIDPYQVHEAKAAGADVILLIAAILDTRQIRMLAKITADLGMETLLEIHNKEELHKITPEISLVGINNRDLKTFRVDIRNSLDMAPEIPDHCIKVSESGISNPKNLKRLRKSGFQGFLIGEHFMDSDDPSATCKSFIQSLNP